MELMQASEQWASRPADERFLSLTDMAAHFRKVRERSREYVEVNTKVACIPSGDDESSKGLQFISAKHEHDPFNPTHWAFSQLAQLAGAPPSYLRTLPAPIVADAVNYGLKFNRDVSSIGFLLDQGDNSLRAATGPKYGRIWNQSILDTMVKQFGDGITGVWRVPGEFGVQKEITKENTTLYAGDQDMFVFLADEENRIENPNRRDGKSGTLARGFFIWNSEVGSASFGVSTFLFDFVCANRIVWGAGNVKEFRMRHTSAAPERFLREITPALLTYSKQSTDSITTALIEAKKHKLDDVPAFLTKRFSARMSEAMANVHLLEEGRPVETVWDAVTAATAYARSIPNQDNRVKIETMAGELFDMA